LADHAAAHVIAADVIDEGVLVIRARNGEAAGDGGRDGVGALVVGAEDWGQVGREGDAVLADGRVGQGGARGRVDGQEEAGVGASLGGTAVVAAGGGEEEGGGEDGEGEGWRGAHTGILAGTPSPGACGAGLSPKGERL